LPQHLPHLIEKVLVCCTNLRSKLAPEQHPCGMATRVLSDEQKTKFHDDGYLVLPGFLSQQEVDAMLSRAKAHILIISDSTGSDSRYLQALLHDFNLDGHPLASKSFKWPWSLLISNQD
jgi:hypothetical protein